MCAMISGQLLIVYLFNNLNSLYIWGKYIMSGLTNAQKVTSVAAAVTAALAGISTAQGQVLEEIIVTATKKAQSLQSIAGTVQAIAETDL